MIELFDMLKYFFQKVGEFIVRNLNTILRICQTMVVPAVAVLQMKSNPEVWVGIIIIALIINIGIEAVLAYFRRKQAQAYNIPIPPKRFTRRYTDDPRNPAILEDDIYEVIMYVAEVEDWLEWTGKLKK